MSGKTKTACSRQRAVCRKNSGKWNVERKRVKTRAKINAVESWSVGKD